MIAAEELMMTTLRQLMTSCDLNGPVLCNQVRLVFLATCHVSQFISSRAVVLFVFLDLRRNVKVDQFKVGAKVDTFVGAHILMS